MRSIFCLLFVGCCVSQVIAAKGKCRVEAPENSRVLQGDNPHTYPNLKKGKTLQVKCNQGYELVVGDGETILTFSATCLGDDSWSAEFPTCRLKTVTCRVDNPANGEIILDGFLLEELSEVGAGETSEFDFSCHRGYELFISDVRYQDELSRFNNTCDAGAWTRPFPGCRAKKCVVPRVIRGTVTKTRGRVGVPNKVPQGTEVTVRCAPGYALYRGQGGRFTSTCTTEGWSEEFPASCEEKRCEVPATWHDSHRLSRYGDDDDGEGSQDSFVSDMAHGSQLFAYCRQPVSVMRCDRGEWSSDKPRSCPVIACDEGEYLCSSGDCIGEAGRCDGQFDCPYDRSDEENCTCKETERACDDGICVARQAWCDGTPTCLDASDETNCSSCLVGPEEVMETLDGTIVQEGFIAHGQNATWVCPATQYPPETEVTCVDGEWRTGDGSTPNCIKVECDPPALIGEVAYTPVKPVYTYNDVVTMEPCGGRLVFAGDQYLTCQADSTWSGTASCLPFCHGGQIRGVVKSNVRVRESEQSVRTEARDRNSCLRKCLAYTKFVCKSVSFTKDAELREIICLLHPFDALERQEVIVRQTWWFIISAKCIDI